MIAVLGYTPVLEAAESGDTDDTAADGTGERRLVKFSTGPKHFSAFRDNGEALIEPGTFLISIGGGQPEAAAALTVSCELTVAEDPSKSLPTPCLTA